MSLKVQVSLRLRSLIFETKLCPGLLQPTLSSIKACCVMLSKFKFCFHYLHFLSYSSCSTQCMKIHQQLSILESCQPTTQTQSPPQKKRFAKCFFFPFTCFLSFETFTVNLYEFVLDRKLALLSSFKYKTPHNH